MDFGLVGADLSKYSSVMYERDSIANDTSTKQSNADEYQVKMQYSTFSLAGEVARYLNISSILAAKILREAQDGMDVILADVNRYNAVLDDIIIPTIFHALFDVTAIQKTEDRDVVLLREPKDAAYYEFSAKDDLVITNKYPDLRQMKCSRASMRIHTALIRFPKRNASSNISRAIRYRKCTLPECSPRTKVISPYTTMIRNPVASGSITLTSSPK